MPRDNATSFYQTSIESMQEDRELFGSLAWARQASRPPEWQNTIHPEGLAWLRGATLPDSGPARDDLTRLEYLDASGAETAEGTYARRLLSSSGSIQVVTRSSANHASIIAGFDQTTAVVVADRPVAADFASGVASDVAASDHAASDQCVLAYIPLEALPTAVMRWAGVTPEWSIGNVDFSLPADTVARVLAGEPVTLAESPGDQLTDMLGRQWRMLHFSFGHEPAIEVAEVDTWGFFEPRSIDDGIRLVPMPSSYLFQYVLRGILGEFDPA
ncbi:hypothetical protein [Salinibacterium sp. ZJ454]|uniref:hypothetical protein n=1 Tax=Salinibacterium sp. ZJ454 TaxID=2708339 RepID=UPI001422EDAB|nr:hypothetical protein [Salinibacterium sp. ZJ454]